MSPTTQTVLIICAGVATVVVGVLRFKLHAFLALIAAAIVVAILTPLPDKTIGERLAAGFGSTAAGIGILIAMAAIVGKCLLDSGAADRIVRTSLNFFGERFAPLAFLLSGFFLGIPVFFDTVFFLMVPLAKAMHLRTKKDYLVYVMCVIAGGTMSHSLVPPTPGPLIVVEQFQIDFTDMIIGGSIVSLLAAGVGYLFAVIMNSRRPLTLRDSADCSLEELERNSAIDDSQLPPFWLAMMPILLPVVLIAGWSIIDEGGWVTRWAERAGSQAGLVHNFAWVAQTLGEKNIAMTIAAAVAMLTLIYQKRTALKDMSAGIQNALSSAGTIILITSAGGAFGSVLKDTGVSKLLTSLPDQSPLVLVTISWTIAAILRAAQGSATVSMITAAGIFAPLALDPNLPFDKLYLALAIGAGSKPLCWMNDSGFWVMTRMSGMTDEEGLMYVTTLTTVLGVAGLIVVLIGVALFPMPPI